ncbi:MAG: hypothetical protein LBG19_05750 [Prevotellaceae bacterium]|jgi:hypothetical protein|nr:hypothetical protein [Prevotellaceae bacterium]
MKKINLSLPLEQSKLNASEMISVNGGLITDGNCTAFTPRDAITGLSEEEAKEYSHYICN